LAPAFTLRPPAPRPAPRAACDPPFTMDSQGYKHYKRECMH
jgi:hypothetical protein